MNNQEYKEKAKRTFNDLRLDREQKNPIMDNELGLKLNLTHMTLGLASELGELVNCIGTELKIKIDRANLKEELGDIYWYISNYCNIREVAIPENINVDLSADKCLDLLIVNISELCNIIKRFIAYGAELNKARELEIIYNIYTALHLFESTYDITGDEIRKRNIAKLTIRYPEKYSDEKAINRNLNEEYKTLE